jgi:hypothetical protein
MTIARGLTGDHRDATAGGRVLDVRRRDFHRGGVERHHGLVRQSIIPDELLGRVNSVYRFFAWGMMPIGSIVGGVVVAVFTPLVGRSDALRWPFYLTAIIYAVLLVYAIPRLSTARLEAAHQEVASRQSPVASPDK